MKPSTIRHTVAFTLTVPKDSPEVQLFLQAAKKLTAIPGVEHFECLQQVSKKNAFDFGLSMEFANEEVYKQYNEHPDHTSFIEQYWIKYVKDFSETDYQLMPG